VLGQRIQSLPEAQRRLLLEAIPALEQLAEALRDQDS